MVGSLLKYLSKFVFGGKNMLFFNSKGLLISSANSFMAVCNLLWRNFLSELDIGDVASLIF